MKNTIKEILQSLELPREALRICAPEEATAVIREIMSRYIDGNPRVWWMGLREPYGVYEYRGDRLLKLRQHIPSTDERCWLILDDETDLPPVLDVAVNQIEAVLKELPFIEYYLVGKNYNWFVCENDHNQIIAAPRTTLEP